MRNLYLGFSLALVAAAGCGGDDGGSIHVPDAKVYMDAAIDAPPACVVMNALGALTFGSTASPVMRQNFDKITSGPYNGKTEFFLAGKLNNDTKFDALFIEVPEPTAGFATNAPYAFQSDATAMTYDAVAYILGDIDTTAQSYAQTLWASQGAITFTAITKTATADINGSVTMTPMRQIDDNTGAAIAGGCTTSVTSMQFFLKQNMPLPREVAPTDQKDLGTLGAIKQRVDRIKALQQLN